MLPILLIPHVILLQDKWTNKMKVMVEDWCLSVCLSALSVSVHKMQWIVLNL